VIPYLSLGTHVSQRVNFIVYAYTSTSGSSSKQRKREDWEQLFLCNDALLRGCLVNSHDEHSQKLLKLGLPKQLCDFILSFHSHLSANRLEDAISLLMTNRNRNSNSNEKSTSSSLQNLNQASKDDASTPATSTTPEKIKNNSNNLEKDSHKAKLERRELGSREVSLVFLVRSAVYLACASACVNLKNSKEVFEKVLNPMINGTASKQILLSPSELCENVTAALADWLDSGRLSSLDSKAEKTEVIENWKLMFQSSLAAAHAASTRQMKIISDKSSGMMEEEALGSSVAAIPDDLENRFECVCERAQRLLEADLNVT